jgi:hypothetical protein
MAENPLIAPTRIQTLVGIAEDETGENPPVIVMTVNHPAGSLTIFLSADEAEHLMGSVNEKVQKIKGGIEKPQLIIVPPGTTVPHDH